MIVNDPVLSNSASSDVTSPENNGSGVCAASVATAILTLAPIFTPDLSTTMRPGSRNRSMNESGSRRLKSTYALVSSAATSAASGVPLQSTRKVAVAGISGHRQGFGGRQHDRGTVADAHRVVHPVVVGQRPPQVRITVLAVGHQRQGVPGDHGVHPLDVEHPGGGVLAALLGRHLLEVD